MRLRNLKAGIVAAGLVLCAVAVPLSGSSAQTKITPENRAEFEKIIHDYILNNPQIVLEAVQKLREQQHAAKTVADRDLVLANEKQILSDPTSPVGGNPKGDVTVVEFFDYRCSVCRSVHPLVTKLMETDANIRRVYKEWPILGPNSVVAARAAIASRKQGRYLAFHDALMESKTNLDEAAIMRVAKSVGLDTDRLSRDMKSPEVDKVLRENFKLAERLNLNGTPSFLVGTRIVRGGPDLDGLRQLVAEARSAKGSAR